MSYLEKVADLFFRQNQFLRFLFVGGSNTLFGFFAFSFFFSLGLSKEAASFLGILLGVLWNFQTTGRLVFESKDNWLVFRFCGLYLVLYLLNIGALELFERAGFSMYLAQFLLIPPWAVLSYFALKYVVFRETQPTPAGPES